jgi:hypothetical protein
MRAILQVDQAWRQPVRNIAPSSAVAEVSGSLNGAIDGFAASALLVMLIDSRIPEAV